MTSLATPHHISGSRRRFITFGGALILAACLTLLKLTLIALEAGEQEVFSWPLTARQQPVMDLSPQLARSADRGAEAWPAILPEPAAGPSDQDDEEGTTPPTGGSSSADDVPPELDPLGLTEGQLEALQQLAARRRQLDERERLLDMRAELNGRAEARLDAQIRHLTTLKEQIEALVTDLDEDEEQKMARLVKIYETMKPKAAAEIFNRLDIPVLLHVVERMKEAKSAVVLGKMNPAIAERVTSELAKRKERPRLDGQGLGG